MPFPDLRPLALAAALVVGAGPAHAIGVTDAVGDYVPGFAGSRAGDLDVVGSFVTYNAGTDRFVFSGTMNADIGASPGGFYVWGVDRGSHANSADFASHGFGGVLFDAVVILRPNGTGNVVTFFGGGGGALQAGSVKVVGSTILAQIDGALLPSTGAARRDYGWNLWPRDGRLPAGFGQISDFAPDNSDLKVTVVNAPVPEPASLALMAGGLLGLWGVRRRRA